MIIRLLEDYNGLKRGELKDMHDNLARVLLARGVAVRAKEYAVDKQAHEALIEGRRRDEESNQ